MQRIVAFVSSAMRFSVSAVPSQCASRVRDREGGTTVRVSASADGRQGDGDSSDSVTVAITDDGAYVTFSSWATDLVAGDTNGRGDVFVAPNPLRP